MKGATTMERFNAAWESCHTPEILIEPTPAWQLSRIPIPSFKFKGRLVNNYGDRLVVPIVRKAKP